ncbi:MAG: glutaminase A, partial [Pseudomonadota bacterium]
IPELSKANTDDFGIAIAMIDGTVYSTGNADAPFTIQSMSKPFAYGYALEALGAEHVLKHVGVEPTGEAFNSIVLDDKFNRPFNPMVNAGAIAVADLLLDNKSGGTPTPEHLFSRFAGRDLDVDDSVFASEAETGHRNRAIAYMMLNTGMIDHAPEDVLDFYFRQCSILVNCSDMALMAATLANLGQHPRTGDKVLSVESVQNVLTLMSTCGMYDYAGQWAYEVGLPAKSGVAGGVVAVIPGQAGIAVWSPPLDEVGNSVRGIGVCKAISQDFALHAFAEKATPETIVRRCYKANDVGSKRIRSAAERAYLDEHGSAVHIVELQGAAYFGSTEALIRHLFEQLESCREIIIDFTRVSYCDAAATRLLTDALTTLLSAKCAVAVSGLRDSGPLAELAASLTASDLNVAMAEEIDTALEAAEDRLLIGNPRLDDKSKYALSDVDFLSGLSAEDYKILQMLVSTLSFAKGEQIVKAGDPADAFFVVASGTASVSVELADGRRRRIASIAPGFAFGEMSIVESGARTADVFADEKTICYCFPIDKLNALHGSHPHIPTTILANMVKSLAYRLEKANMEIKSLS